MRRMECAESSRGEEVSPAAYRADEFGIARRRFDFLAEAEDVRTHQRLSFPFFEVVVPRRLSEVAAREDLVGLFHQERQNRYLAFGQFDGAFVDNDEPLFWIECERTDAQ